MSLDVCEPAVHERMKTPSQWPRLAFVGVQHLGDEALEMRNCACGSTLCRELSVDELASIDEAASERDYDDGAGLR